MNQDVNRGRPARALIAAGANERWSREDAGLPNISCKESEA